MAHSFAKVTISQVKGDMTRNTLSVMTNIINKYKKNIQIRELAQKIINGVREKDWKGEAVAIQNWVRNNIRYTKDINNVETVGTPDHTLFTKHGDCDDQAILVSTLLQSVGHPTRLIAIGALPGIYNHVYAEVKINGEWLPVETTEQWPIGYQPPNVKSKLIYDEKGVKNMNGLAAIIEEDEAELDAALETLVTNALLLESKDELAACMGDADMLNGLFSRLRKRVKKVVKRLKPIVKKVAKVAAIGAAVWFTGGAALALAAKLKQARAAQKARAQQEDEAQQAARAEEIEILRQNAIIEKQNEQVLAEQNALNLLQQQGINISSSAARKVVNQAVSIESRKIQAGMPVQEKSIIQKILPAVAIGAPILAIMAS